MPLGGEKAGVQLAVGGEPCAGAVLAKCLGDRRDHSNLTAAVPVLPALGHLANVVRVRIDQRHFPVDGGNDVSGGYDVVHPPPVAVADVHVFDEAQDVTASAKVPRHRQDLVLVDAAFDDHV